MIKTVYTCLYDYDSRYKWVVQETKYFKCILDGGMTKVPCFQFSRLSLNE